MIEDVIVIDDGPWWAWLDGIEENCLIYAREKGYKNAERNIAEWEKEHGRKIGTASQEEIAYRESTWEL